MSPLSKQEKFKKSSDRATASLEPFVILIAEDDEDDYLLIRDALTEADLSEHLYWVQDGEALLHYLHHQGAYQERAESPRPALILLDLNMPKMDGRTALKQIKVDPELRQIPIVVLTTSKSDDDLFHTYDLGVNSLIRKPLSYEGFHLPFCEMKCL